MCIENSSLYKANTCPVISVLPLPPQKIREKHGIFGLKLKRKGENCEANIATQNGDL